MKAPPAWIFVAVSAACAALFTVQPSTDLDVAVTDGQVATALELFAQGDASPVPAPRTH